MGVLNALAAVNPDEEYRKTTGALINSVTAGLRNKVFKAAGQDLINLMESTPPDKDITALDVMKIAQKWKLSEESMQKLMQQMDQSGALAFTQKQRRFALDKARFDAQQAKIKAQREDELYPSVKQKTVAEASRAESEATIKAHYALPEVLALGEDKTKSEIAENKAQAEAAIINAEANKKRGEEVIKRLERSTDPNEKRRGAAIRAAMKDPDWPDLSDEEQVERVNKYDALLLNKSPVEVVNPGQPGRVNHGKVVDRYIVKGKVAKIKYEDGHIEDVQ